MALIPLVLVTIFLCRGVVFWSYVLMGDEFCNETDTDRFLVS